MTNEFLLEALIDVNVEIQAIQVALEGQGVPKETIQALKAEVDREDVRKEILKRLSGR